MDKRTRFKCRVCGKVSTGRVPRRGDGSLVYPRRHDCPGSLEPAIWVSADGSEADFESEQLKWL